MIDLDELERLAKAAMRCQWGDSTDWAQTCGDRGEGEYIAAVSPDAALELIAEVRRIRSELMTALAECRDAMPMDYDSPHLGGAVGDPLEVPLFVKDITERLSEDLQATKLLAHANAEMFKAEREKSKSLRECWEDQLTSALMNCGVSAIGAQTIFDEMEAIEAEQSINQNTTP